MSETHERAGKRVSRLLLGFLRGATLAGGQRNATAGWRGCGAACRSIGGRQRGVVQRKVDAI